MLWSQAIHSVPGQKPPTQSPLREYVHFEPGPDREARHARRDGADLLDGVVRRRPERPQVAPAGRSAASAAGTAEAPTAAAPAAVANSARRETLMLALQLRLGHEKLAELLHSTSGDVHPREHSSSA
ncbi:hypothetical protein LT493_05490 [Streptomyces tricolor]|nr:hypothetical protein [Streptomyces tricolor]